jgi:hypothetical protein
VAVTGRALFLRALPTCVMVALKLWPPAGWAGNMAIMPAALPFRDATHKMASPIRSILTEEEKFQVTTMSRWQYGIAAILCLPPVLLVTMLAVAADPSMPVWTRLTLPVVWLVWLPIRTFARAQKVRRDLRNGYVLTTRTEVQQQSSLWLSLSSTLYRIVLRRPGRETWQRRLFVPEVIFRAAEEGMAVSVTYLPLSGRAVVLRLGGFVYYTGNQEVRPG